MSGPEKSTDDAAERWSWSWEGHRAAQLRAWAAASPARRLMWLEEAREFVALYGGTISDSGVAGRCPVRAPDDDFQAGPREAASSS